MSKKKSRKPKDCTGCKHCTYIGEGDFVCDKYIHNPDKAVVIVDWTPTENFMQCVKGGNRR